MSALKSVKRPPLLEVPPMEDEWRITAKDVESMEKALKGGRKIKDGREIAGLHYNLRALGFEVPLTRGDMEKIRKTVEVGRLPEWPTPWDLPYTLYYMKRLGLPYRKNDADREYMETLLEKTSKDGGQFVLEVHFLMRQLGYDSEITDADRKSINARLEGARAFGFTLGTIHEMMRGVGMPAEVTERDVRLMLGWLNSYRSDGNGISIAETHRLLRELTTQEGQTKPLPPLREFVK